MGQKKGNPSLTLSVQNQAYSNLYTNNTSQTGTDRRDGGTKPVMIDDVQTLSDVVDVSFATDAVLSSVSSSINTIIGTKLDTSTYTSFSSSLVYVTSSTFVPNITNGANLFSGAINKKSGYYQKIGDVISFTMHVEFADASGQQSGTFQFDLPVAPNNNWSGSWGLVNGTTNIHSNVSTDAGAFSKLYVVNGSKKVYFDGNRGGTFAGPTYTHISAQYTINN